MIPRYKIAWRQVGSGSRAHAVLKIARGRLGFETLCGRPTSGSQPGLDLPECGMCTRELEPLNTSAAA